MTNLIESGAFLLLLVIAGAAMMRFPARRYLLILITATAVGAWLMGYSAGYRTSFEGLVPFLDSGRAEEAKAVVGAGQPSAREGQDHGTTAPRAGRRHRAQHRRHDGRLSVRLRAERWGDSRGQADPEEDTVHRFALPRPAASRAP